MLPLSLYFKLNLASTVLTWYEVAVFFIFYIATVLEEHLFFWCKGGGYRGQHFDDEYIKQMLEDNHGFVFLWSILFEQLKTLFLLFLCSQL